MVHVRDKHWADEIADEILATGRGPHEISTGISPSGEIHIGNLREVITADVVHQVLKERGIEVTLDYVADNFDPLRKVYPFLDAAVYSSHIGKPLSEIPCPCGGHPSYAAHFLEPFLSSLERLRIRVKVYYADQMYKSGMLVPQIVQALRGRDAIARILHECTGRKVEPEWIPFKGMGDMKKSKGNVLSVHRMLEVLPPEVLRYLIVKTQPMRAISFDPGLPLLSLMDEFDDAASQSRDPRALKLAGADQFTPIGVPFRHLVNVVQMADFDLDQVIVILRRNKYPIPDPAEVKERAGYAIRWLREFAPDDLKFSVQRALPPAARALDAAQRAFLSRLAGSLRPGMSGEEIHALIYEIAKEVGMEKTTAACEAIYQAFLGQPKGPRAGWFLAFLEHDFVVERLHEAGKAAAA